MVKTRNVDKMSTRQIYASWGTTEERHLERMLQFIRRQNERVSVSGKGKSKHNK